jgi:phosphoenolpyruvate phosphomutase
MKATQPVNIVDPGSKCGRLRLLLQSPELEFILEAHNGISARLVEEAGFKGIWASGLAMSAQFGVRDSNEASWTQIVEVLEFMSDVTDIPILLDGDTGYGNFNNMRRLVKKLEQRNIAGVCIEDKQFPKTNSFIDSERQPLANVDEFCGKIKAGKDSQDDEDFCIVARVEALIAGWGLEEALLRAEAYHEAGADAVLIHSKLSRPDEIIAFAREWAGRLPLIIVPTKYYSTPTEVYRKCDISMVIWANHMIRASIAAMERVSRRVFEEQTVASVEDHIASVNRVFSLQGVEELNLAQNRYLKPRSEHHAIVLAASRGNQLHDLTEQRPKVMLSIDGQPLLQRMVTEFRRQSINQISVVAGYKAETIDIAGINLLINKDYETTGELDSLTCARDYFQDDLIVVYGDLLFRGYILNDLVDTDGDFVVVVDSALPESPITGAPDYAYCSREDDRSLFRQEVELKYISEQQQLDIGSPSGRWIGMLKICGQGRQWFCDALDHLQQREDFNRLTMPDLLNHLIEQGKTVKVHYINGHWLDVNTLADIERAGAFTRGRS